MFIRNMCHFFAPVPNAFILKAKKLILNFQKMSNPGNINQNLNEIVRNQLMSRGMTIGRNNSPYYIKQQDQERKKAAQKKIQQKKDAVKTLTTW